VVTSTFLVTLFSPLFYVLIYKALGKHRKREKTERQTTVQESQT
jgi:HAE1 family hydrophobic/amphiphilic exporter-1